MGSFISLVAAVALSIASAPPASNKRVKGQPAHRFRDRFVTNKALSGVDTVDLNEFFKTNEYQPRWLVVNFTASWCVPCRAELKDFAENAERLKKTNLMLLVIVVDEDINMEDPNELLWALTTRFQPATDMFVIPRSITSSLEPSAAADGLTSKLMLDLTVKENFRGEVAEPTDTMRQQVLRRWAEYGLK